MSRRDLRNEADYLPTTVEDLVDLRRRVIEAGHSAPVANGLVGWLLAKSEGEPDASSSRTRSTYRKILAELAPVPGPDPGSPPPRRLVPVGSDGSSRHLRRKGGKALVAVLLAGAASLGVGAHPKAAEAATRAPGPVSETTVDHGQVDRTRTRRGRRRAA